MRDTPSWDRQVQVLAAQGWWVLRPNFRGSGGYGQSFARQGWTRWGDRMQDDVEDAVAHAVAAKGLDASKVAIVRDGPRTVVTMASDYRGSAKEFAMVIPVNEVPDKSGSSAE